ncbi:uncharacterized protein PSFLO_01378 [Pseudozyma flocculosa]|uniref:Uncharacterized protein n=1 Tax=Pseudozyma flocculosa TaxID=84751 RepID=A0A5C3EWY5_9BASI|nr:uncharacterized protein PSFLO_01378 [Pseudozyma flocculosa]
MHGDDPHPTASVASPRAGPTGNLLRLHESGRRKQGRYSLRYGRCTTTGSTGPRARPTPSRLVSSRLISSSQLLSFEFTAWVDEIVELIDEDKHVRTLFAIAHCSAGGGGGATDGSDRRERA